MSGEIAMTQSERVSLGALRYAVNDEAPSYLAVMRLFTSGMSSPVSSRLVLESL